MQALVKPLCAFLIIFVCHKTVYAEKIDLIVDPGNIAEKCKGLLENFAAASSAFTECAVCYARPIKLCERCIFYYLAVLQTHIAIEVEDSEGHACKTELINLDRLEVIEGAFKYVTTLWERGECDDCFVLSENGTLTSELSNVTLRFQNLYRSTNECISNHYNQTSQNYDKKVCSNCSGIYHELNVFYDEIKTNTDGRMCIDIVDLAKLTQCLPQSIEYEHLPLERQYSSDLITYMKISLAVELHKLGCPATRGTVHELASLAMATMMSFLHGKSRIKINTQYMNMNSTRSKWSKRLGCGKPTQTIDIAFLTSMFLIATTPIVFYSVAKQFSDKGSRRLLRQTRLAQTLTSHVAAESS